MKNQLILSLLAIIGFQFSACGQTNETVLRYELIENVYVDWDAKNDLIILSKQNRELINDSVTIASLIPLISDTTSLSINVCSKTKPMVKGDLAFLLLYKLQIVPIFSCFQGQFDAFPPDCYYPYGILDILHENRNEIVKRLKECIRS